MWQYAALGFLSERDMLRAGRIKADIQARQHTATNGLTSMDSELASVPGVPCCATALLPKHVMCGCGVGRQGPLLTGSTQPQMAPKQEAVQPRADLGTGSVALSDAAAFHSAAWRGGAGGAAQHTQVVEPYPECRVVQLAPEALCNRPACSQALEEQLAREREARQSIEAVHANTLAKTLDLLARERAAREALEARLAASGCPHPDPNRLPSPDAARSASSASARPSSRPDAQPCVLAQGFCAAQSWAEGQRSDALCTPTLHTLDLNPADGLLAMGARRMSASPLLQGDTAAGMHSAVGVIASSVESGGGPAAQARAKEIWETLGSVPGSTYGAATGRVRAGFLEAAHIHSTPECTAANRSAEAAAAAKAGSREAATRRPGHEPSTESHAAEAAAAARMEAGEAANADLREQLEGDVAAAIERAADAEAASAELRERLEGDVAAAIERAAVAEAASAELRERLEGDLAAAKERAAATEAAQVTKAAITHMLVSSEQFRQSRGRLPCHQVKVFLVLREHGI